MNSEDSYLEGTRGPYRDLEDYILGITHEIWESRQVEKIYDYYSPDTVIYTLSGIVRGAEAIVRNTRETLAAFPDRLLLGDAVIGSREGEGVFYSSHRIQSPMTHLGDHSWAKASGRRVRVTTIADCWVDHGVITREWLVRDNLSLARQMGLDVMTLAEQIASAKRSKEFDNWLASERSRVGAVNASTEQSPWQSMIHAALRFAWAGPTDREFTNLYAPYAVLYDSAPIASGLGAIQAHWSAQQASWSEVVTCIDHLCVRTGDQGSYELAARWGVRARHSGEYLGLSATGAQVYVMGVSHYRIVAGRIAAEWTIYDKLALLAQLCRAAPP